ncbi:MAG: dTMP kinase [Thermodesulfovibrionia bacterium]
MLGIETTQGSRVKGFISFEGIEGTGKTTQVRLLADYLKAKGYDVITTEEPGGTPIGRKIRELLLHPQNSMDPLTELLLYYSSRAQHIREVIYPSLVLNRIVITDRFTDSTIAYQGYGRGIDLKTIKRLNEIVTPNIKPFLTFLLDIEVEEGLRRNREMGKDDRFEIETIEFHKLVRKGYLKLAGEEPNRIRLIDASRGIDEVHKEIVRIFEEAWG